jgi:hypothetical protein
MQAEPGSVYGHKGTMKDVLARCLKKIDVQVRTLPSIYILQISSLTIGMWKPTTDRSIQPIGSKSYEHGKCRTDSVWSASEENELESGQKNLRSASVNTSRHPVKRE